jgi:hypothetical protein
MALEQYFNNRERLDVLVSRIDESCFVLRDLARDGFIWDDPFVPQDFRDRQSGSLGRNT